MAIKAQANITITKDKDTESVWRYYRTQSSTLAAPVIDNVTVRPPKTNGVAWVLAEPPYDSELTNTLYFVDCTVFTDGTILYSSVSQSSSFEAAKDAKNTANSANTNATTAITAATDAQSAADSAQESADGANELLAKELVASSYAEVDEDGSVHLYGKNEDGDVVSQLDLKSTGVELSDGEEAKARMYSDAEIGGVFQSDQMISETFRMGRFAWVEQTNGHLTLKDMGEGAMILYE